MIVEIFSVRDAAAERFMDAFCAPTIAFALRGFEEACTAEAHQFTKFPDDYALYHVASFDAVTGIMLPCDPKRIALATTYVAGIHE